ncbi:McrC family protein [Kocuria turfanensis]|uniref:McrC family protein n=1 Tax=Kocuria turfanensis TaxID=388357 RepID=UPI0040353E3E
MLQLTEWETSASLTLNSSQRHALETRFEAVVRATGHGDEVTVRPSGVVGSVTVSGVPIVVRPKIPIDRVLFMTAYAADPFRWEENWSAIAGVDDLGDGMAALFVAACRRTLQRGLLRSYRTVDADLPMVKGRVRWNVQARRLAPLPVASRFQVHDDDITENRILREALAVLRHSRLTDPALAAGVDRLWRSLEHVRPLREPLAALDAITWTRQNEHYRQVLGLARVVLENSMADLAGGTVGTVGFTLRLHDIFERFVRTALREAVALTETEFPDSWRGKGLSLAESGQIPLVPDLGVRVGGQWRFVGDVKYKRDDGSGHEGDLYQLLAYATATGLPEATLIYAQGPRARTVHEVRHAHKRLYVRHLDLSASPQEVLNQVHALAERVNTRQDIELPTDAWF